ncbi:FkbM family methyltransferase [Sulfitobacter guttiformis]|uniref:FkbM family methyltransferase n=1 Tax=Sulfitobacter guttiformis TaxID=74349 RepID=A0A420DT16_9RHOB|nr:FkbM family methyltransferase [Sulfitobacter guttiformis]KIN74867.1 Methyltransferase FkbM family protein [Sulfitobacter guttiformis KCTC 32187]RKE97436.1 FkbM family methyltransferase [Sulfitobacter guttiformis]
MSVIPPDFPHSTAINAHGFYCIPGTFRKREVAQMLLKGEVNEPRTLSLMRQFAGNGDVVSGGAFVGDFLPFLSRSLKRGAYLHSFEPNPTGFAATTMTVALNDLTNVRLSPVAVGNETGVLPLLVADAAGKQMGGTSMIVAEAQEGRTVDVEIVRIDDLVPADRKVSVLQLDIEGYEWQALEGAPQTIGKGHPLIVLETLAAQDPREIEKKLRALCPAADYTFMGMIERNAFYKPFKSKK